MFKSTKNINNKQTTKQLDLTESNVSIKSNAVSVNNNNNNINEPVSLLNKSDAFKGISFTNISKNDDLAYRGSTQALINDTSSLDMPFMGFNNIKKSTKNGDNLSSLKQKNINNKIIEPKIIAKTSEITFIPSKCKIIDNKPEKTPEYVNEYTSIIVNDCEIDNVVEYVDCALNEYSNEIEYNLNKSQYLINGIVYIMNIAVNFAVEFFIEGDNDNDIRVEFRRINGDTFAFEELFINLKDKINKKFNKDKNDFSSLPDLMPGFMGIDYNMSFDDSDSKESSEQQSSQSSFEYTDKELQTFTSDLNNGSYCIETLDELAQSCKTYSSVSTSINNNTKLYNAILSKLTHQDITCVRSSLLLLNELINKNTNANILPIIFNLLTHSSNLIKSYAIKTLNALTIISWTKYLTPNIIKLINNNLKNCEKTLKISQKFLTKAMFNNIYAKLV